MINSGISFFTWALIMSVLVAIARNTVDALDFDVQKQGYHLHNHREIEKISHALSTHSTADTLKHRLNAGLPAPVWLFSSVQGKEAAQCNPHQPESAS